MAVHFCGPEAAIHRAAPQCEQGCFGMRTCKAAMTQMRDSPSRVVQGLRPSPKWTISTPRRRLYTRPSCPLKRRPVAKEPTIPKDIASLSFEDALKELEGIVQQLERGQVKLDEAITAYERGALLKQHCEQKLAEAKMKVEKIVFSADGTVSSQPADLG